MTFNWWTFVFELINFLVLAYVLHRLLYRPLHAAIDSRREKVKQAQTEAEHARTEAERIKQQLQEKLVAIDQQRQLIVGEAQQQAEAERKKILDDAQKTIKTYEARAHQSLNREREEMLKRVSAEAVDHAVRLAEQLLQQAADTTLQEQLIQHLLEVLSNISEGERQSYQREWHSETSAELETAVTLDAEILARIQEGVSQLAGKNLTINTRSNTELIAGVRLRIGGHLWDASIVEQFGGSFSRTAAVLSNV